MSRIVAEWQINDNNIIFRRHANGTMSIKGWPVDVVPGFKDLVKVAVVSFRDLYIYALMNTDYMGIELCPNVEEIQVQTSRFTRFAEEQTAEMVEVITNRFAYPLFPDGPRVRLSWESEDRSIQTQHGVITLYNFVRARRLPLRSLFYSIEISQDTQTVSKLLCEMLAHRFLFQ